MFPISVIVDIANESRSSLELIFSGSNLESSPVKLATNFNSGFISKMLRIVD